jgi:hypothetical protein
VSTPSLPDHRVPVAVLLTSCWESSSEAGWITRQVAGAIAAAADVHVVTPGSAVGRSTDSVFTVHRVAAHWNGAADVLADVAPDLALVAGHSNIDAVTVLDGHDPEVPWALLPLVNRSEDPIFPNPLLERARTVLAITEDERHSIVEGSGHGRTVERVGAPLAANPSALTEPNTWVGTADYVLVVTGVSTTQWDEEAELARIVRLRFPDTMVGISHTDAFCVWHRGRPHRGWPIERRSDMARLMAWARVTVDLRPGGFFGRRSVESLLYGTPIVVPHDCRAREHAERGRGGLWFENPAELSWCVEAMLDPPTRDAFSEQGRSYAEEEYGSTDRFIERILTACELIPRPVSPVSPTSQQTGHHPVEDVGL